MSELGKLDRVEIREVWTREGGDFTPWLAKQQNIQLLGETIGLDLEVEAQEKPVGPFRADILCKDTATDQWVLIENQLERTDHTHLGQLLTYAAGLDAVTIVWISPSFTDEHRAALDWLNSITDDKFNFFGLEIETWRIGDSPVAPKFNIVSKPNDWTKAVADSARNLHAGTLTETRELQLEYWGAFKQLVDRNSKILKTQKPVPQHWSNVAIGRSGFHLAALMNTVEDSIGVALYIRNPEAKQFFRRLLQDKAAIEADIGSEVRWLELPDKKESRIEMYRDHTDPHDRTDWAVQHQWLLATLESFHKALSQRIKVLDLSDE